MTEITYFPSFVPTWRIGQKVILPLRKVFDTSAAAKETDGGYTHVYGVTKITRSDYRPGAGFVVSKEKKCLRSP